jgi:phosphoribosyl-ATP pyrophosphohydrolase
MINSDIFDSLMEAIHQRAAQLPEGSYTTKLIRAGTTKMGAKILEEALETIVAAQDFKLAQSSTESDHQKARSQLVYEACDVLYHLWVLLGSNGITTQELRTELARREGVSGIQEKLSRPKDN